MVSRYQAKGNYATAGSSYTKAESDGRYQSKGSSMKLTLVYTGEMNWNTPVNVSKNLFGHMVFLQRSDGAYFFFYCANVDGIYAVAGDNSTFMTVSNNGNKIEIIAGAFKPVKIFIFE